MTNLQQLLSNTQYQEISQFLLEKYKGAMPVILSKTQKRMDRPRRPNRPNNNKNPKQRPFKRAVRRDESKMDTKKLLTALLKTLK